MAIAATLRRLFSKQAPATGSFGELARRFHERLPRWPAPAESGGPRVAVLVTTWVKTAVPFFALECALALRNTGCQVTVLWDDSDLVGNAASKGEVAAVETILKNLPEGLSLLRVAHLDSGEAPLDDEFAASIVRENAVWKMRGESEAQAFIDERPTMQPAVRAHLSKVFTLLRKERFDQVLIPGGVYGVSAAYLAAARQLGHAFSVFDSGPGLLLLSHRGIAAHHDDTATSVEILLRDGSAEEIAFAIREGQAELDRRIQGTDEHRYQLAPATGEATGNANVLVPLNLRWDAAALSRLRLFDSVEHWLTSLLDWASATPEARLCIRQHPVERHASTRSRDDLSTVLGRYAHLGDRLRFVAAADPVNSYDLQRAAKVVLPFTSSAGLEAAMLDRAVVLGTHCYYEHLPFVQRADSIDHYFQLIRQALADELKPTAQARDVAAIAYYFTQRCAYLRTRFTPVPDDFRTWVDIDPQTLWAEPCQTDLMTALRQRLPLPLVQHRRFFLDSQSQK